MKTTKIGSKIEKATVLGSAALVSASQIIVRPMSVLAQDEIDCSGVGCVDQGQGSVGNGDDVSLFGENGIFDRVTSIMLFLVGAVSVIMLIVGGIRYVVSGGDQNAVQGAKNTIMYAIIGIVVAFLAFAAVSFVTGNLDPNN